MSATNEVAELVPTDFMGWESKVNLKTFVDRIMEENVYTPDVPELFQHKTQFMFVYGTLKRGYYREHMLRDQELLGSGFTIEDEFIMYRTQGGKGKTYPIIFPHFGAARGRIHGELYSVQTDTVPYLDFMEGNGLLYCRTKLPVTIRIKGTDRVQSVNAWTYVGVPKSWHEHMNHKKIELVKQQTPTLPGETPFYVYMKKYEKDETE